MKKLSLFFGVLLFASCDTTSETTNDIVLQSDVTEETTTVDSTLDVTGIETVTELLDTLETIGTDVVE